MAEIPQPENTIASLIDQISGGQAEKRPHLGASILGHECDRWLWLSFRWAVLERYPGRVMRLFKRGQDEEAKIVSWLTQIGVEVHSTGDKQTWVDFGSHVSGSIDGIIERGVPEAPTKRHVLECKTHSARSFKELTKNGVLKSQPRHWAQVQIYMAGVKIDRALYFAICKDDDSIYTERVHYDKEAAQNLIARGHRLALAERLPEPLSADPTWYQCKFCPAHKFCFEERLTQEVNCRTCALSTPLPNSTWACLRYDNAVIPVEAQREGCDGHVLHPDLVPWKFHDSPDGLTALYEIGGRMVQNGEPDGTTIGSKELISGSWRVRDDSFGPFGGDADATEGIPTARD